MQHTTKCALLAILLCAGAVRPGAVAAADDFWSGAKKPEPKARVTPLESATIPAVPTVRDIDALLAAVSDAWERTPLTMRRAMFVKTKAAIFGGYDDRGSNVFAPGEPLLSYLEPVGYGWKPVGSDSFQLGLTIDFLLKGSDGKVIAGQDAFQSFSATSHVKNKEFYLNMTMSLNGLDPGSYVLIYTVHDNASSKVTTVEQPFTIKG